MYFHSSVLIYAVVTNELLNERAQENASMQMISDLLKSY